MAERTSAAKPIVDEEAIKRWADVMNDDNLNLAHKLAFVAFSVDYQKDPEGTIIARGGLHDGSYEAWIRKHFDILVNIVAHTTGGDPAQILNAETRTKEQQKALEEAAAQDQVERWSAFLNSDYMKIMNALGTVRSSVEGADSADAALNIKEIFAMYFFTLRPDIHPAKSGQLTKKEIAAMIKQYKRFDVHMANFLGSVSWAEATSGAMWLTGLQEFIIAENPQDAQSTIEHLKSVLPEKFVMPNNKLANMAKGLVDAGAFNLIVSRKGAKKRIETACLLTYEGDENVKLSGKQSFTEYDRNVYNAVSSLYIYGDQSHIVTPAMVYRAMTGMTETENPSPAQIDAVTRSLDKMRFIRARINCTDELRARRITLNSKQINSGEIDTYLLAADLITVSAGGQVVKGYRILKEPILHEYSEAVNQVLTLPSSLLDIKELDSEGTITTRSLPNTESRILIRGYLLRRIEGMKGKNGLKNDTISLYDYLRDDTTHQGLYSIAGRAEPTRTEAQRIRDDAEKMLAYWKAVGYIKGYTMQTEKKKITGFKLSV